MKRHHYFTKFSHVLFDEIIPEVTRRCAQGKTAAMILFLMERKTAGYHREYAEVSIPDMMAFTSASLSDTRRARSWLLKEGYLHKRSGGIGLDTSCLRIVLEPEERESIKSAQKDSDNPVTQPAERPVKIVSRPAESSPPTEKHNTPSLPEETKQTPNESARTENKEAHPVAHDEEVPQTADSGPVEPHHQTPAPAVVPHHQTPAPETVTRIFHSENALKASDSGCVLAEGSSRDSVRVLDPGLELEEETNIESGGETEEKKTAFGSVCSFAHSQNAKMEDRDYAFAHWAVKSYGAEVVEGKIQIAKFQTKRGATFSNPLGWLRNALTGNYQPAKSDVLALKARENARRRNEISERKRAEAENERRKWASYREQNPDAAKEAYAAFLALARA